jgi:hypothetical protein
MCVCAHVRVCVHMCVCARACVCVRSCVRMQVGGLQPGMAHNSSWVKSKAGWSRYGHSSVVSLIRTWAYVLTTLHSFHFINPLALELF